jgi:hypothetical protein
MPNIPYPEFNDFHVELSKKVVQGSQPIEGFAFLSMNALPNCVRGMFRPNLIGPKISDSSQILNARHAIK